jgi:hypothetical protein
VGDNEIAKLPDPRAWWDARFLAAYGAFNLADLESADYLTMQLVWRLRGVK